MNTKLKHGQLLLASTGLGKTFAAGALIRRLEDRNFTKNKSFGHVKYLYVTRATVVTQAERIFQEYFNLTIRDGVEVLNIEQLRSRAGAIWIKDELIIQSGKEVRVFKWRPMMNPVVILWDECQALKNEDSIQHQVALAFSALPCETYQVFISATPFTRVSEAKCFAVSTCKDISQLLGMPAGTKLTAATWPTYASAISQNSKPDDYNEAAVERLVKDLDSYIVRVRGARPQFEAENSVHMIEFETVADRHFYEAAWDRYLKEKAKLEKAAGDGGVAGFMILVQFLKFRMAAELCRAPYLARKMFSSTKEGLAACAALNFKGTIIKIVMELEKLGVSRDKISLVWGGGQTALTKKQKTAIEIKEKTEQLLKIGMTLEEIMKSLDITEDDLLEAESRASLMENIPEHLQLGAQSKEERQREIDKFQSGRSVYCLYTFRAGGVGLSLHHSDELTKVKCRRKKNGYVVVEDIPLIPVRPRINFVAPTYSAMELVQGLGRCPRLTSLSTTKQELIFYRGTIEDSVARIVSHKLKCLSKVVRMRESWADCIVGGASAESHITNTKNVENVEDEVVAGEDEE
jgi:hypothetical protein